MPSKSAAASPDPVDTESPRIVRLADDQWVQIRGEMGSDDDAVTVRGATREEAQELFDSLIEVDGALAPPSEFVLVEHVADQSATAEEGWFHQIAYGESSEGGYEDGLGDVWVGRPSSSLVVTPSKCVGRRPMWSAVSASVMMSSVFSTSTHR